MVLGGGEDCADCADCVDSVASANASAKSSAAELLLRRRPGVANGVPGAALGVSEVALETRVEFCGTEKEKNKKEEEKTPVAE